MNLHKYIGIESNRKLTKDNFVNTTIAQHFTDQNLQIFSL